MSQGVYVGSDGIERAVSDLLGKGTFHIAYNRRESAVRCTVLGVLFGYPALFAITSILGIIESIIRVRFTVPRAIVKPLEDFLNTMNVSATVAILSLLLFPIGGIVFFRIYARGKECRYQANGEEFTVFEKNKTEHIYYADVIEVSYTPRQLLNKYEHGYDVKIVTKYKTIVYKYVFPRLNELVNPEKLPFEIIRERIKAAPT